MKLTVVGGYHEYFLPAPLPPEELACMLARTEPNAFVPRVRWAEAAAYHAFLYGAPGGEAADLGERGAAETERRVALFLEYLQDAAPRGAEVFALLPFEGATGPRAADASSADVRLQHLVTAARATLGEPPLTMMNYYTGKDPALPVRMLRYYWFERSVPRLIKAVWAHHRYLLFDRDG